MSGYFNKPNILLTNDDGLEKSEGLNCLFRVLRKRFAVTVVAPFYEQSGTSQSITILSPIFVNKISYDKKNNNYSYAVKGTPTDCIKIAFNYILKKLPDFVVSGINLGANVGLDIFYSGTVAAAIESSFWGVTSFAISVERSIHYKIKPDLMLIAQIAERVIRLIIKSDPPRGSVFNINIPLPISSIKGIKMTQQNLGLVKNNFVRYIDPKGHYYYWMKYSSETRCRKIKQKYYLSNELVLSDLNALKLGYISITPLKPDFTDNQFLTFSSLIKDRINIRGVSSWLKR
jgi:5'-nucleotidase